MQIITPPGTDLDNFLEKELERILRQSQLDGYALIACSYTDQKGKNHEVDALLITEDGKIICIEAKNYSGVWRGNINTNWTHNDTNIIESSGQANPYKQVHNYGYIIKDKLKKILGIRDFYVYNVIVVPQNAVIEIKDTIVDKIVKQKILICHINKITEVIERIPIKDTSKKEFQQIPLEIIVRELTGLEVTPVKVNPPATPVKVNSPATPVKVNSPATPVKVNPPTISDLTTAQPVPIKIRDAITEILNKAKNYKYRKLLIRLVAGVSVVTAGFIIIPYLLATKIEKSPLKIGILSTPESYKNLENYINTKVVPAKFIDYLKGKKIEVIIDGDKTLSYTEAQNRMENKLWDISFSTSPINSIFARQKGYVYVASMFPKSPNYQSGLFVKKGSSIKSLNDINSKTIVALGGPNSASSFYMPAYDLYGKTITATIGHRGQEIVKLVKNGQVDVGAAAIGDSIRKDDPELDIIHVSRDIPGSGVYLSPGLSKSDQENIKKLLLSAPEKIKDDANYGKAKEPDYTEFEKITERVEEILICSDFTKDPVTLGCSKNAKIITIEGKINGVSNEDNQTILKISDNKGEVHDVSIPLSIAQKVFGSNKLTDIQGKLIRIAAKNVKINNKLLTNEQTQIKVLNKNQ